MVLPMNWPIAHSSRITYDVSRLISFPGARQLFRKSLLAFVLTISFFAGALAQDLTTRPQPATLDERLGADDGFALAILITANMRGNLELCDCHNPRGGLARRIGYLDAFKKKFKDAPVLQVEAGQFWYTA
jgi:hypothetical protein